jgi:hypothetical protein
MQYNILLLLSLMLFTGSHCERTDTNESITRYPDEEQFDNDDVVAFYLNDLLWVTQGQRASSSLLYTVYVENEPEFYYQHNILTISSRMTFVKKGKVTFDQKFQLFLRYGETEPIVVQLNSDSVGSFRISDHHQKRRYETDSDHTVRLEITHFDTLNKRIEGFFEGSLKREDTTGPPVTISDGRFAFTYY